MVKILQTLTDIPEAMQTFVGMRHTPRTLQNQVELSVDLSCILALSTLTCRSDMQPVENGNKQTNDTGPIAQLVEHST